MLSDSIVLVDHLAHSCDIFGIFKLLLIEFVDSLQLHRDFVGTILKEKFFLKTLLLGHLRRLNDLCGRFSFHSLSCPELGVAFVLLGCECVLVCLELSLQLIFDLLDLLCGLGLDLSLNYCVFLGICGAEFALSLLHPVLSFGSRFVNLHQAFGLGSFRVLQLFLSLLMLLVHLLRQFLLFVEPLLLHHISAFTGTLHLVTGVNLMCETSVERKVLLDGFAESNLRGGKVGGTEVTFISAHQRAGVSVDLETTTTGSDRETSRRQGILAGSAVTSSRCLVHGVGAEVPRRSGKGLLESR